MNGEALTREQVERMCRVIEEEHITSAAHRILAHDQALRDERDTYRNAIIDVGIKLGLIMPERVKFFAAEGVKAVDALKDRLHAVEGDKERLDREHTYDTTITIPDLEDQLERAKSQLAAAQGREQRWAEWKTKVMQTFHEIEQRCGKSLGYPWFKDDPKNFPDATEADGVCIGEHVPETIVDEVCAQRDALAREQAGLREAAEGVDETWDYDESKPMPVYMDCIDTDKLLALRKALQALAPEPPRGTQEGT